MIRILILTSSTGGGHDARARAFVAWMQRLHPNTVETRVEQMLEHSSRLAAFGVWFYNFIQNYAPWLHVPYYIVVEGLSLLGSKRPSLGGRYFEKVLNAFRPHLIFSVHDCLNRGYFYTARKLLGEGHVRCATYCSEFSGGFGYSRNWVEQSVDLYISRTREAHDYAVNSLGLPEASGRVYGKFLEPHAYDAPMDDRERFRYLTEDLKLNSSRKTILLGTGGAGANNHIDVLNAIRAFDHEYQAIVVCGRNERTFEQVQKWMLRNPRFLCHVVGYTSDIYRFMQVSCMVLTRGGTTTCSEALHFGCQIVFNGMGGTMPQESLTVRYFMKAKAAAKITSAREFGELLGCWNRCPDRRSAISQQFAKLRFTGEPRDGVDHLFSLARLAQEKAL